MQKNTNNSGITLIALIITIIVMLILVAVTVNTAVQSGLFGHAKNAVEDWKATEEKESNIGNDNYIKDTINQYTGKVDRSFLKVGDYVDYTPTTAPNYIGLGTSENENENPSGSATNPTEGITQETTLKWRILNINNDGSVDIISETPTESAVYLKNPVGYNNGVLLLNDLCANLYSNSTLGVTARSIDLMDIENKMNSKGISARNDYTHEEIKYGDSKTYTENYAYTPDIYKHSGKTTLEESSDYYSTPTTLSSTLENDLTVKQTYYAITQSSEYYDDLEFYNLIFNTSTTYWIASRFAGCEPTYAHFGIRYVINNRIGGYSMIYSYNTSNELNYLVRPVVTLGANIKISAEGGTADVPRTLSK